jgi:hypothetical protein
VTRRGDELLAQCIAANVRQATFTTNALLASYEDRLRDLADAYTRLYDALAVMPDTQRTVYVERLLERGGITRSECDRILIGEGTS